MRRKATARASSLLTLASILICSVVGCRGNEAVMPFSSEHIELTKVHDGQTFHLVDNGNVYREVQEGKRWEYHATVFDPDEVRRGYLSDKGVTFRIAPDTGERFEVVREMQDSFEDLTPGVAGLARLLAPTRLKWGSFTLQSPQAPNVADYVALRNQLVAGSAKFRDCSVEVTGEKAHTGKLSLKCLAPPKTYSMVTCKASLSSPLPYFRQGDDFWFEGWYWIEGQLPLTLVDLESEFIREHAGVRLRIYEDGALGVELKALDKPQYRQSAADRTVFPKGRWVQVRVHYYLDPSDGKIEIWQDEKLVMACPGQTLPFRSAIYNSLEVGISAHSDSTGECLLYLDDVRMSATELTR